MAILPGTMSSYGSVLRPQPRKKDRRTEMLHSMAVTGNRKMSRLVSMVPITLPVCPWLASLPCPLASHPLPH